MSSEPADDSQSQSVPEASPEGSPPEGSPTDPPTSPPSFFVAGIGASAGGLEALESLVHRLTPNQMSFVVLQHLAPGHVSMLADILQRSATIPVTTIDDGVLLEAGRIYVAPPVGEVSIQNNRLRLTRVEDPAIPRHSIDAFLRSLARTCGPMALGVILSGSGSDGTLGLKAIKAEGGITFAQDPSSAAYPSMPQSALDSGSADFQLTPAEIGDELVRLGEEPSIGRARIDNDASAKILAQLRVTFGVDFTKYKPNTIERRIGRRMALHKHEKIEDYLARVSNEPGELRSLYNDLLIGVTSFFRDAEPFQILKEVVFPRLFESRSADTPIRLWVAGCATGEEAYTLAIVLLEFLGDRAGGYKIQIFATDVDEDALLRARQGAYPSNIELDVSPERLQRFFVRSDKGYQVSRQVRDLVVFARHNLGKDPPFSRVDLVTCRNVLIYMQTSLQRKVLRIFHYALNPDSYLLLGTSESVGDAADQFWLLDRKVKVYVKKDTPAIAAFEVSFQGRQHDDADDPRRTPDPRPIVNVTQMADRRVIEKYGPPGVIVDDRLDVIQFRGRTGAFLEPAPGAATLNLLKLVRPELLVAVRAAVQKSLADALPVASPAIPLAGHGGNRAVAIDVMPLPDAAVRRCLLVLFNEVGLQGRDREVVALHPETPTDDPRFVELERELETTKEYLQTTIEELEAANEELQSSNEELQSSNEELQSTVEELETSKEELQSTNEELATVNDELQNRMGQLSVTNDDLQNLLAYTGSPVIIVGADLRIRRVSSAAEKLLSLIPADVGRPIAYLRNVMSARDIEAIASDAMSSVSAREQRVRCIDGSWHLMKMMPYVTAERMIRGVVIEFVEAAAPDGDTDAEDVHPLAQRVLSTLPQAMALVDRQRRLVWANRAFFEAFAVSPSAIGAPLADAWGSATEPTELWAVLEELFAGRAPRDVVMDHPFGRETDKPMRFSGRRVSSADERPPVVALFIQEV